MTTNNTKKFTHDNQDYEIRCTTIDQTIHVRVHKSDGSNANIYSYNVTIETLQDAIVMKSSIDPLKAIIEMAENDVRNDTEKKYLAAIKALEEHDKKQNSAP